MKLTSPELCNEQPKVRKSPKWEFPRSWTTAYHPNVIEIEVGPWWEKKNYVFEAGYVKNYS